MFAYQERTSMHPRDILKLPFITFILGMADAPQIDYTNKKEEQKEMTAEEQATAFGNLFG